MLDTKRISDSRVLHSIVRRTLWSFLIASFCLFPALVTAQPGSPGPSSPLYGARPETGKVSTGLPTALRDVRIEQKLDQQLPLDLLFHDESGQPVKLGQYFGQKPVVAGTCLLQLPDALHPGAQWNGGIFPRASVSAGKRIRRRDD